MRQPMAAPILRCRPVLVKGMPIFRLILALAWEIPRNRFQEKPPLFMIASFLPKFGALPPYHKCSPKREHHYRLWVWAGPGAPTSGQSACRDKPGPTTGYGNGRLWTATGYGAKGWIVGLMPERLIICGLGTPVKPDMDLV